MAYQEKGGGSLVLFQRVQNGGGVSIFVSGVKGQEQHFFVGVHGVIGMKLAQVVGGSVGLGRFSFFLETQSPAAFGSGRGSPGDREAAAGKRSGFPAETVAESQKKDQADRLPDIDGWSFHKRLRKVFKNL